MSHHQSFSQKIISQHSSHALTSLRPQTILFSHRNWVTIWFISLAHTDLSKLSATPGSGGPLSIQPSLPGGALIGHHFFYSATTRKISISSAAAVLDISPPESWKFVSAIFAKYAFPISLLRHSSNVIIGSLDRVCGCGVRGRTVYYDLCGILAVSVVKSPTEQTSGNMEC